MQELLDNLNELQKSLNEKVKTGLKTELDKFFINFPEIKEFGWTQYVPGFNDGDPCVFTIGGTYVLPTFEGAKTLGLLEQEETQDDYENLISDMENSGESLYMLYEYNAVTREREFLNNRAKELYEVLNQWESFLSNSATKGMLESTFETNARISATRDSLTSEEYDCGY